MLCILFVIVIVFIYIGVIIVIVFFLLNEILCYFMDDFFIVYIECFIYEGFGFLVVIFYIMVVVIVYLIMFMSEEIFFENDMEVCWMLFCMFNWYVICFFYVIINYGVNGKGKIFGLVFVDFLFVVNILSCIYFFKWYVILF